MLHLTEIWPFPAEAVAAAFRQTEKNVVVENNATGQLASLIQAETLLPVSHRINKWDGRPISPQFIINELTKGVI